MPLVRAPTKGQCRTAWPTPLSGRGPGCFYTSRAKRLRLAVLEEAVGRLRVVQIVFMAGGRHGWRYPLCEMSSGHLSVARRQRATEPCFRRLGNSKAQNRVDPGAMVRKARSTGRARDCLAAGLQPGQPSRCLYATILGGENNRPSCAAPAPDRRQGPGRHGIVYSLSFSPPSFTPRRRGNRCDAVTDQAANMGLQAGPGIVGNGYGGVVPCALGPLRHHLLDPLLNGRGDIGAHLFG